MPTYTTTPDQQDQLLTDGYVILPDAVPAPLLTRLQDLATQLEKNALDAHAQGERLHGACVLDAPDGAQLVRYDDILALDAEAALGLLACPAMMAVARELCGRDTTPLQMDILYKHQGNNSVVLWHQGAPHARNHPYLNVGIYLDDAGPGDGCLRYVPGTQHELQDICTLAETHGWNPPGVIEQPAKAGDILVQDMMVLHSSEVKSSPGVRRTIYVELRPATAVIEEQSQSAAWAELRRRWMSMVVARADPSDWPAEWCPDLPDNLGSESDEIAAIISNPEPPIPAVYGTRSIRTADYPFPAT